MPANCCPKLNGNEVCAWGNNEAFGGKLEHGLPRQAVNIRK